MEHGVKGEKHHRQEENHLKYSAAQLFIFHKLPPHHIFDIQVIACTAQNTTFPRMLQVDILLEISQQILQDILREIPQDILKDILQEIPQNHKG